MSDHLGAGKQSRPPCCAYCGDRIAVGIACAKHADLLTVDPHYTSLSREGAGS